MLVLAYNGSGAGKAAEVIQARRYAQYGNLFVDVKLPHAEDLLVKAELAAKIIEAIQQRRLTQIQAAAILAIDQPKISALKQGKLSGFSIERLLRLLLLLGRDIEITVKGKPKSRSTAKLRVA